jgi:BolA protein
LVANKDKRMPEGPIATIIREKLTTGLSPVRLEIEDDS